ncbi:hypothetical protein JCM10207_007209 [Rhodosporidiobolus poonsookiae]
MLIRLRPFDTSLQTQLCLGWLFSLPSDSTDEALLRTALVEDVRAATTRVVKKWPLLAGRGVWLKEENVLGIEVPSPDKLPEKLFTFTQAVINSPCPFSRPLSSASSGFLPLPLQRHFQSSGIPRTLLGLARKDLPLLALHSTFFHDAVAFGITLPHQAFDGTGAALVVKAINSELWGLPWSPPPFEEANPLTAAIAAIAPPVGDDLPAVHDTGFVPLRFLSALKLVVRCLWEEYWWRSGQPRYLFLRRAAVDRLVRMVKEDVRAQTDGKEYVSTSDVLTAWIYKTADSLNPNSLATQEAGGLFSTRKLVSTSSNDLALYPHNAFLPYPLFDPPVRFADFSSLSLADLALRHRHGLARSRTQPIVAAFERDVASTPHIPRREFPLPWPFSLSWFNGKAATRETSARGFSNNVDCGFNQLVLPDPTSAGEGKLKAPFSRISFYFINSMPLTADHTLFVCQVEEGYVLMGSMRPEVRKAFESAAEEFDQEK